MSLNSINHLLKQFLNPADWQEYHQYRQLVDAWSKAVPPSLLSRTRPLYIKKKVLWVATVNAVWVQQLQLQRRSILKKLQQLGFELSDVRFSTHGWHSQSEAEVEQSQPPSVWPSAPKSDVPPLTDSTPDAVFERWLEVYRGRTQHLPLCPQCQSPTPPGELQRWSVCAACMAQKSD